MKFAHIKKNGLLVISLEDERLDTKNTPKFKEEVMPVIDKSGTHDVVFDLNKLKFIDSSGIGAFLSVLRHLNARGGDLKLASINPNIQTVLELISIHKIFHIFKTTDEAINACKHDLSAPN